MESVRKSTSLSSESNPEELWRALKCGDQYAFECLYRQFAKGLFQLGISISGDADFTQDCIQELFIDLWKYRENIKATDNVRLYLFRSLSNRIHKENRRAAQSSEKLRQAYEEASNKIESVETTLINTQRNEMLQRKLADGLQKLPVRQNEVIQYLYFESLSYEEVAKVMGINLRSVYTLAWKALATLRKALCWLSIPLVIG
ncbi:RNA polymerase sigma factor [Lunatimonas salinarum]|uniref:RNA polymerase sigma factor n=1 Tax=Lunatimonas salinarum TaxID=1774590 RepID=UPI001ADF1E7A|nr:sigma-70 family RNA polymerase sigma factor [Lunatimonas salinarum]